MEPTEDDLIAAARALHDKVDEALRRALPEVPDALLEGAADRLVVALNEASTVVVPESLVEQGVMLSHAVAMLNYLWVFECNDDLDDFVRATGEACGPEARAFAERIVQDEDRVWRYVPMTTEVRGE